MSTSIVPVDMIKRWLIKMLVSSWDQEKRSLERFRSETSFSTKKRMNVYKFCNK